MMYEEPICFSCKHFDINALTCTAFAPAGFPGEILGGDNDHKKPLRGQKNSIVFEPIENEKPGFIPG